MTEDRGKRPPGRPRGRIYGTGRQLRMSEGDLAAAAYLARLWGCSLSEALRRAVREVARREGMK